jgi:hypothetical protein
MLHVPCRVGSEPDQPLLHVQLKGIAVTYKGHSQHGPAQQQMPRPVQGAEAGQLPFWGLRKQRHSCCLLTCVCPCA